jgi:SnoaL-like domain
MSELDTAAVRDTISRYGRCNDDQDWDGLTSILAGSIRFDFTSLWGGEPETVTASVVASLSLRVAWVEGNQAVVSGAY